LLLRERDELERDRERDDDAEDVRRAEELLRRVAGLRRCAAGTSSVTTAFDSVGISRARKLDMRSSSRRICLAS
jgi:hypothetical protein